MNGLCSNCGAALRPQAHFCPRCGAPAPAAVGPSQSARMSDRRALARVGAFVGRHRLALATSGVGLFLILATAAAVILFLRGQRAPEPVARAPTPEVTPADAAAVASLTELANEYDTLQRQADDANKRIGELLTAYQRRGGTLPPNFGPDLTDEQRAMLAERIREERAGLRNLLQEILDRNKEIQELRRRVADLGARLPAHVVAREGDRHDRIAMDFLIKQGVSAERAYQLVSQVNLQETMLPGFRVWTYYQNGQFGTWVTQGTAVMSPQEAQRRVRAALESERDEARRAAVEAKAKADAASKETGVFIEIAEAERRKAEEERKIREAEQELTKALERERNTIHYAIGSKNELVRLKAITGNMRQVLSFERAGILTLDSSQTSEIRIDGSAYGLKRIRRITLVPPVFDPRADVQVTIDGPFAVIRLLNLEKFRRNQFIVVLE